jgi:hypothetical protein
VIIFVLVSGRNPNSGKKIRSWQKTGVLINFDKFKSKSRSLEMFIMDLQVLQWKEYLWGCFAGTSRKTHL